MSEPRDVEQMLATALAHHDAGRTGLAEAGYRNVLSLDPDDPDALNLLGVLLQERGDLDQSAELLSHAVAADPEFPEALANLARARRLAGDAEAAADLARRAIAFDPELPEAYLNLGQALIRLGNEPGAAIAFRQAVGLAPDSLQTLALLGRLLLQLKDAEGAVEALSAVMVRDPGDIHSMIALGAALAELERLDEALAWHEKAASLATNNPAALGALASTLNRRNDVEASAAACRRVLALVPDHVGALLVLGANLTSMGKFAEAEACIRHALLLDPNLPAARRDLALIGRHDADGGEIRQLRAVLDDLAAPARNRMAAGIALGTLFDRAGDYDAAFAAYETANTLIRAGWIEVGEKFDAVGLRRYVDWTTATFTPDEVAAMAVCGDESELPVFIVGMPRSGTTLVEQILASHKQVFGAGERKDISQIIRTLRGLRQQPPSRWDRAAMRDAAAAHVAQLGALGGAARRVTDKMPDNVLNVGHIAALFPRARIIVCRRDLRDVCLSCYFQHTSFARTAKSA